MELRNSVWNELCTNVSRATTKMNVQFVPRFFICLQAVNTHRVRLLACMLDPSQDSLSGFLRHGYKKYLEIEEV